MDFLYFVYAILLSYLIGAIPTSYIFARAIKGIDIREHGSGNVGATNLMRVIGKVPGVSALLIDVVKGVLPVTVLVHVFYKPTFIMNRPLFCVLIGLCAVCGHIWTIFLKFRGGKGVATTIGVFLGLAPIVTVLGLFVWLILVLIFRYVSLGSLGMAASLPILMIIFGRPFEYVMLSIVLCVFISYKHKSNIKRLLSGTEYKIGQHSQKT